MTTYTPQETFDGTAKHLLTQNCKALTSGGACRYREGNLRCAAGVWISDDDYTPNLEGVNLSPGHPAYEILKEHHDMSLLAALQTIHDTEPVPDWPCALNRLAHKHGLNPWPRPTSGVDRAAVLTEEAQ